MATSFAEAIAAWNVFYALAGGAAATLLGLLFVAVSLRLDIFHRREVADVRAFATFTMVIFLVAMVVAGLAVAPHEEPRELAAALFVVGVAGLAGVAQVIRLWVRLNLPYVAGRPGFTPFQWQGWAYLVGMTGPHAGLVVAAFLLWGDHFHGLGWLAIAEGWLLTMGTVSAWIMLSHAGGGASGN